MFQIANSLRKIHRITPNLLRSRRGNATETVDLVYAIQHGQIDGVDPINAYDCVVCNTYRSKSSK